MTKQAAGHSGIGLGALIAYLDEGKAWPFHPHIQRWWSYT